MSVINVKVLPQDDFYKLPEYQTAGAAGMDLCSAEDTIIELGKVAAVSTGIAIELPAGYEAQIRGRSGLGTKGIMLPNAPGTIDSDYRGKIHVLLSSVIGHYHCYEGDGSRFQVPLGQEAEYGRSHRLFEGFVIRRGDRIAQMVFAPVVRGILIAVASLEATERGAGGFGSTGVQ